MDERLKAFQRLLNIIDELREKCPWDKKQTYESLRAHTIEETYELADAIIDKDSLGMKGELGDLMMHIVFYSKIASEKEEFTIADVINGICEKLIYRHPHIYGNVTVKDEDEVNSNWEKLKLKEGRKSVLEGVPSSLPAIIKASRIQEKVKGIGFDWDNGKQVFEKVLEELEEFKSEVGNDVDKAEQEFGDVLFSLINYARFVGVNPEMALERTNKKFMNRFQSMEKSIQQGGKKLSEMTLEEMNTFWEQAKLKVG